ncbi:MAG: branched-chain amino acid ABC transporter permease [Xanthobacteraceae bacterium]
MLQTIVNGLLYGGTLAVAAVGFSLIFGVMNIINLAHGVFVIGGAYAALVAWAQFGIDPFIMLAPLMCLGFGLGWLVERLIIGPSVRKSGPVMALLVTFGVSLIVANLLTVVFSSSVRNISPPYAFASFKFVDVSIDAVRGAAFLAALVLIAVLALFLRLAPWGRTIRATAQMELAARLCGVDTRAVYALTFAIGSAFAMAAGVLIGLILPFTPAEEVQWTVYAFIVVTLGGVGSPAGALLGGLLLGLTAILTQTFLGAIYTNVVMFVILLLMLLVRPNGLLGSAFRGSR